MNILVGYIPTPEGLAAIDYAIEHAVSTGAKLTVLNTGKDGNYSDPVFATSQDIDALESELATKGVENEIRRPTNGLGAADSLLAVAEEIKADLIVIGIRRRSAVGKLITGSTAQAVLLGADCPVVGVKPKH
ncbi:MAG TPA: universal stress protein [Propionibacteriaceae bacterium]